jgi:hypothetical protein
MNVSHLQVEEQIKSHLINLFSFNTGSDRRRDLVMRSEIVNFGQ